MVTSDRQSAKAERLLPVVLDERALSNPQRPFAKISNSPTSYSQGFRTVTYAEVTSAINHVAQLLERHLGKPEGFPTIAYIGPSDLRYSIVVVAAIKVGYKTFLPSPRNSKAAHISLLKRLNCTRLVVTTPEAPCVPQIVEDYAAAKLAIPSLAELLGLKGVPNYAYTKSFEEAKDDPIFVLHTSGSTGIPKPLTYTNAFVTGIATNTSLEAPDGYHMLDRFFRKGAFFMTLPAFHVAGIGFSLIVPSFWDSVPVYPLPSAPPTTEGMLEAASKTEINWAFVPPVVVDQLGRDSSLLDLASSKMQYFFFTGGSVPKQSGDIVAERMGLYQCLGSSECATFPTIRPMSDSTCEDWNYVQIHPAIKHEFQHRFDDLHELVVIRDAGSEHNQPVFNHFPNTEEYLTRDLFSPHPTKHGLWTHKSRIDDVIVFLNGEKTNPISFEQEVASNPVVKSALVGGEQRFEAFLLVELKDDKETPEARRQDVLESLWPSVETANSSTPAHARIAKNKIILASPSMPFPRAGKGTVQRKATMELYREEIEKIYDLSDHEDSVPNEEGADPSDKDRVSGIVHESVKAVTTWPTVSPDDEFFDSGMDSLQVLRLVRELKSKIRLSKMAASTVYAHPSVNLLTEEIAKLARGQHTTNGVSEDDRTGLLKTTLQHYQQRIDALATVPISNGIVEADATPTPKVVVLTGSTGALGSYLLQELLADATVSHVYCLNRSKHSAIIQQERNVQHKHTRPLDEHRVTFLTADLSKSDLGLDRVAFDDLLTRTTQIIHNAWPVDFNKTLISFRPSLDGVLHLASFAADAAHSPSILFISSISSVINYQASSRVPETIITDLATPAATGYGQSKYLAERMLDVAAQKFRLNVGVVRVGQICGTATNPRGWNKNEWFPSLVLSSRSLGLLPASLGSQSALIPEGILGSIDWTPIDRLAEVIVEFGSVLNEPKVKNETAVFHTVNPHPVPWTELLSTVRESLASSQSIGDKSTSIEVVPYSQWFELLRESAKSSSGEPTDDIVAKLPGIKLLDFYESLSLLLPHVDKGETATTLDLTKTLEASKMLRSMEAVKPEWIAGWIKNWYL